MNQEPDPRPTEASYDRDADRTTVPTEKPTVSEAQSAVAITVPEDANRTRTPLARTLTLEGRGPSLTTQSLGFEVNGDGNAAGTDVGETVDLPRGLTTSEAPPTG